MKTASVLAAVVAVISAEVEGRNLVVNQPRATGTAVLPDDGVSPKPTSPPGLDHLPQGGMFRRAPASNTLLTAMIAPDNTCGWISASVAVPYTCGAGATCGLVLAQKTLSGVVMCFNDMEYNFRFGCIDYDSYFSSSACDHLCAENTQVMKCTESAMPYCNTIAFPGGVRDYWCNSINYSTAQLAQTTWRGQTDARIYTRIVQHLTSSAVFFSTRRSVTDLAPTATNAENSGGASETGGVGDGDGDGNGNGSRSGSRNGRGRKTPVGAIVGGVVGGVAAIGLGLSALFLFLRRKKSKAAGQTETPPSNQSPMQPGASPGMPMTQAYHDPKFSVSPPPPPQEYPPQQQYPHTTPSPQGGYYPQQSLGPSSPTASHMTNPRLSHIATSPTSTPTPTPANASATPPPDQLPQPQPQPQQHQPGGFQPGQGQQHYGQRPHTQPPPSPGPVHEASAQTGDDHRGQMHELG